MNSKSWNRLIGLVNQGNPPEALEGSLNAEEMEAYRSMYKDLMELRKKDPKAAYWPVENDWE